MNDPLTEAKIVAAILRGDPATASLAARLDIALHRLSDTREPDSLDVERLARAMEAFYEKQPGTLMTAAEGILALAARLSETSR